MSDFGKNRVLALYKILTAYTDELHQISMQDILVHMEAEGYSCSEDSILRYIKQLRNELGVDVISGRGRNARYFIGNRLLEKEEMKLIIDSVNASNFIEKSIATKMIDKLKSTMSLYDAEELDRSVLGINTAKAENKKILYNVNLIQEALSKGVQISFDYMVWDRNKKLVKKSDRRYNMNPWADNWQYRDYLPTSPFKGQMSCVRELKLVQKEKKYILKQLPVKEMECLRTNKHEMKNIKMGADEEWTLCDKKEVLELDISYPIEKIHAQTFGIKISTGKNRQFEIVFCKEKQCCFVDRTTAGINPHDKFAGKYKAPVDFTQEFLTIKLLMDVSQSELFINNGEVVMSNLLFPEDFYKVKLFATGGDLVIEKSIIYEMDEIMNHPLDGDLI